MKFLSDVVVVAGLSLAGQFESTLPQSSGMSPFSVINSILNVDLNADLLDGQHGTYYLNRTNHTGFQAISTITGLQSALDNSVSKTAGFVSDANLIPNTGFYYGDSTILNSPILYPGIIEVKRADSRRGQIAVDTYGNTGRLFVRSQGLGNLWSAWNEAITTGNQATLVRGNGIIGNNYTPLTPATWSIDFGSGALQAAAGNHTHTFDSLVSKPTSLGGYGITDAYNKTDVYTKTETDALFFSKDRWIGPEIFNLNLAVDGGVKHWGPSATNVPAAYGTSLTFVGASPNGNGSWGSSWTNQLLASTGEELFFRQRIYSYGEFGPTYKIWTSKQITTTNIANWNTAFSGLSGKENSFSKGSLIPGSGVNLSGTLTNRLVGAGDITVSVATAGSWQNTLAVDPVAVSMPIISRGTAVTSNDYLQFKPTDYGVGKPYLAIAKSFTANKWEWYTYDGATTTGILNFALTLTNFDVPVLSGTGSVGAIPVFNGTTTLANSYYLQSTAGGTTATISSNNINLGYNNSNRYIRVYNDTANSSLQFSKNDGSGIIFNYSGDEISVSRTTGVNILRIQADNSLALYAGGVSPLSVSSSIVNTNFNADYVDGYHATDLLNRAFHSGSQSISTIAGLQAALDTSNARWISGTTGLGNADSANDSGFKTWGTSTTNVPAAYGTLFTFVGATDNGNQQSNSFQNQMAFSTGADIYFRQKIYAGGTYSSWQQLWTNKHFSSANISNWNAAYTGLSGKENVFSKGNIIQGTNVTISGSLNGRLVGAGDITISASGGSGGGGTVTSVGMTVPTGFYVSSSPVTGSGNLSFDFAGGYSLPTTSKQNGWDTLQGQVDSLNSNKLSYYTTIRIGGVTKYLNTNPEFDSGIFGGGNTGYIPIFTGSNSVGNSGIRYDSGRLEVSQNMTFTTGMPQLPFKTWSQMTSESFSSGMVVFKADSGGGTGQGFWGYNGSSWVLLGS